MFLGMYWTLGDVPFFTLNIHKPVRMRKKRRLMC